MKLLQQFQVMICNLCYLYVLQSHVFYLMKLYMILIDSISMDHLLVPVIENIFMIYFESQLKEDLN